MNDKEKLLKLLQHEISICNKLDAEYKEQYYKALGVDEIKARCLDDLRTQLNGKKHGLEIAINYIESILK